MMDDYKSHKEHFKGGYDAGGKMGYSHGGNVKDSPLVTRTKKTASNAADQEAGDQGELRPGYKKGGKKEKRTARASKFLAELVGKKREARTKRKPPGDKKKYAGGGYAEGGEHDKDMDYGGGSYKKGGKMDYAGGGYKKGGSK